MFIWIRVGSLEISTGTDFSFLPHTDIVRSPEKMWINVSGNCEWSVTRAHIQFLAKTDQYC